jgi:hypothetical protein
VAKLCLICVGEIAAKIGGEAVNLTQDSQIAAKAGLGIGQSH